MNIGNRILIVGGSKGLGAAFAQFVTASGRRAVVVSRSSPACAHDFYPFDLNHLYEIPGFLERIKMEIGAVQHIVFCQRPDRDADWDEELKVATAATGIILANSLKLSSAEYRRSAVIVSSITGTRVVDRERAPYHASKGSLHQLARYYSLNQKMAVNLVSPGPLDRSNYSAVSNAIWFLLGADGIFGQELVVDGGLGLRYQE